MSARTRRTSILMVGGLLAAATLLAGCGSAADTAGESAAPAVDTSGRYEGTPTDAKGADGGTTSSLDSSATTRAVIVTSDMTVRVDDLARASDDLDAVVARHHATIASRTTSNGVTIPTPVTYDANGKEVCPESGCPTDYRSSVTTLRVVNSEVPALVADLEKLGTVESSVQTSQDVTAEVADVDARVANARVSLARIRVLMDRATSISDVVALEAELSRRQGDLEALEARQRALADQTAQATVTVRLVDVSAPAPEEETTGFVAGLQQGWNAFTAALTVGLTILGAALPFLIVLVPVGFVVLWAVRRSHKAAMQGPSATSPSDDV